MKSYKTFVLIFFIIIGLPLSTVAAFNYYIDPLWTFDHSNDYNDVQTVIDERQQKMNDIHYGNFHHDTLLIGSSRSTYINQYSFGDMDVYNFAASDLSFKEYKSFIAYATKENGEDFEQIIIGVDFFKSSIKESKENLNLKQYKEKLNEPFYRFKNLISLDVLDYSRKNYRLSKEDEIVQLRNYNRRNVAFAKSIPDDLKLKQTKSKIKKFKDVFYGEQYSYNPEFKKVLTELKETNPDTEFIFFTTPISTPLFMAMVEEGDFNSYVRWLNDMVIVFDGVYNFMYPNKVTNNLSNYFDGHHFYPKVGDLIASKISKSNMKTVPSDFGVFVTEQTFDEHIQKVKTLVEEYREKKTYLQ
ncbi:hypothetical protein LG329_08060 [Virgibacillus necropolis]|uniref:hypothetical protein n=1 Tax=Virgibacillus necropolis TaxID=163877 RepID=UPI00384DB038